LSAFFRSKGIIHQYSAPYSPQQNGSAERLNRTLNDRVRAMLLIQ
jgi:transposase InsO family protein